MLMPAILAFSLVSGWVQGKG